MVSKILCLMSSYVHLNGWSIPQGDPRLVSLNGSYHKEQQYIRFKAGI